MNNDCVIKDDSQAIEAKELELQRSQVDYSLTYLELLKQYREKNKPLEIDFRELVDFRSGQDRFTHLLHTYPAKLLLNIPYFFLNCSLLCHARSLVLDPFCGSGTVLLEAILSGADALGVDSNPLARLIAKVKSNPLPADKLTDAYLRVNENARNSGESLNPQKILDWNYWYSRNTRSELGKLLYWIQQEADDDVRDFLRVCLSQTVRKTSLADPTISVPVKLNPKRFQEGSERRLKIEKKYQSLLDVNAFQVFGTVTETNISRMEKLYSHPNTGHVRQIDDNAMNMSRISDSSVDLIITSPPYAGAQKYIRSSGLSIGWLGLTEDGTLRGLEKKNIGREHYSKADYMDSAKDAPLASLTSLITKISDKNPLRAHIATNYLNEMKQALNECYRVLRTDGTMILVLGNNVVCGYEFDTQNYIREISENLGFKTVLVLRDEINSRGLMTKRNKTASLIACEWVTVLKKV